MNSAIKNNIYYQDEEKIIYPAGYHVVLQDLKDQSQLYYQGQAEFRGISCVALSPLRRYLAVGAKGIKQDKVDRIEKPAIFIYDTFNQKKKKTLQFNDEGVKQWVSLAFAPANMETKTLVSLSGGGGDVIACFWQHDKNKCLAWIKLSQSPIDVYEIAFNNNDASFVSCIGNKVFKCYKKIDTVDENNKKVHTMKPVCSSITNCPAELNTHYKCHTWLTCENFMALCTESGEIIICNENVEFMSCLPDSPIYLLKQTWKPECITTYTKGFIVGGENCMIFVYKQTNDNLNPFEVVNRITVTKRLEFKDAVKGISITPHSEDKLVCSLSSQQIFQLKLKKENIYQEHENQQELVSLEFHQGPINGMDLCVRKPLIATCGSDKFIKVWNYEEKTLDINWSFSEEAQCISFHPSGFHLAAAFSDRLKLMNVCNHNTQSSQKSKYYKEITPFKQCREIKFSNGGQYLAAVNGATTNHIIHVFKFYTAEQPNQMIFKGHTGRVRSIAWSQDDTVLVSCGQDGMIFAWRVDSDLMMPRIVDQHQKGVIFQSIALTLDSKLAFAPGNDRNLYQVEIQ